MPPEDVLASLNSFFIVISLVMGLLVGSFCNVCVGRWPHGESVVSPRSRCPKCMNAIAWFDNIPLLSWIILGAKCRHCKAPISWQYPLVEALTGVLFVCVYLRFGMTFASPVYMLFAAALVVVTFQDLADWTIPDEISKPGIPIGLALAVVVSLVGVDSFVVNHPFDSLGGIVLGGGILYLLDRGTVLILKKPGMGMGDVKLLAMMGAFIGWKGVLGALMAASFVGSAVGLLVMLYFSMKGESEVESADAAKESAAGTVEKDGAAESETEKADAEGDEEDDFDGITLDHRYLPFGPYLALGGLLYLFFGPQVLHWYLASMGLAAG